MEQITYEHVKIAEIKTGSGNKILKTVLGSCVGIAFLWKNKNRYGLAHCLLPQSPEPSDSMGAKYVDQAVPSLLNLMKIHKENYKEIEAILAGGGNMTTVKKRDYNHIGLLNGQAALKILKDLNIKIIHQDLGGNEATQMWLNCEDGSFEVSRITKQKMELGDYATL